MSKYWLFTATPEHYDGLKEDNFSSFEFPKSVRRLAAGVQEGDKCAIFISKLKKVGVICQVTSKPYDSDDEKYPFRVNTEPELVLDDEELLDFQKMLRQLSFISPKQKEGSWGSAVVHTLRKIPEEDFRLIESEMRKMKSGSASTPVLSIGPDRPSIHEELTGILESIGKYLGKSVDCEWKGAEFRHDVVWKEKPFRTPSMVFEVCDGGSLEKDILALEWARVNLPATAILVVAKDGDYDHATRRLPAKSETLVVKGHSVRVLYELLQNDSELLRAVFKNV